MAELSKIKVELILLRMWGYKVNRRSAAVHTVQLHATTLQWVGFDRGKYDTW